MARRWIRKLFAFNNLPNQAEQNRTLLEVAGLAVTQHQSGRDTHGYIHVGTSSMISWQIFFFAGRGFVLTCCWAKRCAIESSLGVLASFIVEQYSGGRLCRYLPTVCRLCAWQHISREGVFPLVPITSVSARFRPNFRHKTIVYLVGIWGI
jgi:hypothetical protein